MAAAVTYMGEYVQAASQSIGRAINSLRERIRSGNTQQREEGEDGVINKSSHVVKERLLSNKTKLILQWMRENLLLTLTIAGVIGGVLVGLTLRLVDPSLNCVKIVSFPGELLIRMLKILILPLTVSSLIAGMAKLDLKTSGRIGTYTSIYYLITSIIAVIAGVIVAVIIHPGDPKTKLLKDPLEIEVPKVTILDAILDIVRNMFPENLVQASFQQVQTLYEEMPSTSNSSDIKWKTSLVNRDGSNIMSMIIFSLAFGFFAGKLGRRADKILEFFSAINEITMMLVKLVMWYSPFGILCLISGKIMGLVDGANAVSRLGLYIATVITGLLIYAVIILPLIYFLMTRKNPLAFFLRMLQAWLTALATASSAASLPVTYDCLEINNAVDERISRFVTSMGASINKDGTALYEAVAAIFIAQMNNVQLGVGSLITVCVTAILASMGAAAIPSTGLITMILILSALGLPSDDISLLFAVDWILDRIRTSVNVLGNAYGAGIIYNLLKSELPGLDIQQEKTLNSHSDITVLRNNDCIIKNNYNEDVETNM